MQDAFFFLSKLIAPLLTPLALSLTAVLALALGGRAPWRLRAIAVVVVTLWLFSTEWVSQQLVGRWEAAHPVIPIGELAPADAIVVLGGMSRPARAGLPYALNFGDGADRILTGVALLQAERAPLLLITGRSTPLFGEEYVESAALASWVQEQLGVEASRIEVQSKSRTTAESARYTARLARERGWQRLVLVTSALHMRRAVGSFRQAGLDVVPYPTDHLGGDVPLRPFSLLPTERSLLRVRKLMKEMIGVVAYRLSGRL